MCLDGFLDRRAGWCGYTESIFEVSLKWGKKGPNPVLPEGAAGMGMRGVPGALPAGSSDLYGPNDARGYTACPLVGPGVDFRAETAKMGSSISEKFGGFCVTLQVYLKG